MEMFLSKIATQAFATENIAIMILFSGCIYFARLLAKERQAREAADAADRAFAEEHTKALYAVGTALAKIEGVLTGLKRP